VPATATTTTTWSWLAALPRALRGGVVVQVLDRATGTVQRFAGDDVPADGTGATPERRVLTATVEDREVVVSFPTDADADGVAAVWQGLIGVIAEREQLQRDLESMYPTSLALLEEASMWGDVLPTLPTGRSEEDVAEIGVRALVVAASVERALYVRWRPEVGQCEVLVHVAMDRSSASPRIQAAPEPRAFVPDHGLIAQALHGSGAATLARVAELGAIDGPERLALRELIAVPVRYGVGDNSHTLGVLLVMDKCTNSYTAHTELSSHETKLAHAVAAMLGSVLGTRRVAELGKELETAQEIHRQIKAGHKVAVPGFDVAGSNRACGTVGGDYFDFLPMADGRTLAAVMDVSGHNLASGMLMVSARMSLRLLAHLHGAPTTILTELARAMHDDLVRTERFISAAAVALAPGLRRIEVVNAGHLDTLVLRAATGTVECLPSDDVVLGFTAGVRYQSTLIDVNPDDVVLLYTDGVTETTDASDEMFGADRLSAVLRAHGHRAAHDVVSAVLAAVDRFRGAMRGTDDVTVVAIRTLPAEVTP
jgi:hypothetical protein